MPVPTPDEIRDQAATDAAAGVQSFTAGDETVQVIDPEKSLRVADKLAGTQAVAGTNPNGGRRSGWGRIVTGRVVSPGPGDC